MSAIRLARGFTGRDKIVKFAGCYHGHVDALLAEAGSGVVTLGIPGTPGVPGPRHRRHDRPAVQRPRRGRGGVRGVRRRDRLPDHRGRARQHGRRAARARLQRVPLRDQRPTRCVVHQRRGDDRVPGQPLRTLGRRRCRRGLAARPGDVRQGHGRRVPGRRIRRASRRDGAARAGRPGLPGRHAVGQSDRDDRRPHHLAAGDPRGLRAPRRDIGRRCNGSSARRSTAAGRRARRPERRQHVQRLLGRRRSGRPTSPMRRPRRRGATEPFFHAMLDAGVYLPPSAFECWFLSAAHDEEALSRIAEALPGAAQAAAAATPDEWTNA